MLMSWKFSVRWSEKFYRLFCTRLSFCFMNFLIFQIVWLANEKYNTTKIGLWAFRNHTKYWFWVIDSPLCSRPPFYSIHLVLRSTYNWMKCTKLKTNYLSLVTKMASVCVRENAFNTSNKMNLFCFWVKLAPSETYHPKTMDGKKIRDIDLYIILVLETVLSLSDMRYK